MINVEQIPAGKIGATSAVAAFLQFIDLYNSPIITLVTIGGFIVALGSLALQWRRQLHQEKMDRLELQAKTNEVNERLK